MRLPPAILLTRPDHLARSFATALPSGKAEIVISPVLTIVPLTPKIRIDPAAELILTSQNAVIAAAMLGLLQGRRGLAVGFATAQAAREAGMHVALAAQDARALTAAILARGSVGKYHHLRGQHVAGAIADKLNSAGLETKSTVIYDQRATPLSESARALFGQERDLLLPLFSPRSATLVADEAAAQGGPARLHLVSISAAVDAAWEAPAPVSRCHAAAPRADAMIEEIRRVLAGLG